jgi:hypothetical protein
VIFLHGDGSAINYEALRGVFAKWAAKFGQHQFFISFNSFEATQEQKDGLAPSIFRKESQSGL